MEVFAKGPEIVVEKEILRKDRCEVWEKKCKAQSVARTLVSRLNFCILIRYWPCLIHPSYRASICI